MKKMISFLCICIFCFVTVFSQQPTQAGMDKMLKQAKEQMKEYGNDSIVNNVMKGVQDQQKQVGDTMKNQPADNKGDTNGSLYADLVMFPGIFR